MNRKVFCIIAVLILVFAGSGILYHKTFIKNEVAEVNNTPEQQETADDAVNSNSDITPISIDEVEGITAQEAERLCYNVLGERDEKTGFTFSFGTAGAVEKDNKQYYVIRASWLVNNSHMSYIGDFFVSSDGKVIYTGVALQDEYVMENIIWSK